MPLSTALERVSVVLIVSSCLPLFAQNSSYHLEVLQDPPHLVVLVNDSKQPIEGFHVLEKCETRDRWWSRDALTNAGGPHGTTSDIHGAHTRFSQTIGVEPGGRWDGQPQTVEKVWERATNETSSFECLERIDAVIFADGSWDGDEAALRSLMAQRDGVAAGLKYWAEKYAGENPDGSTLSSIIAEAKRRQAEDEAWIRQYASRRGAEMEPLLQEYWTGRFLVDANVLPREVPVVNVSGVFRHATGWIGDWQEKLDNDVSLKKLRVAFPATAVPTETAGRSATNP
jgi:hypothetical protein